MENEVASNKYRCMDEWLVDFEAYKEHESDEILSAMHYKINNSEVELQLKIRNYLYETVSLEDNPWAAFRSIMASLDSDKVLITKSDEDPWFNA